MNRQVGVSDTEWMNGIQIAIGLIWIVFWVFWIAAAAYTRASIVARGRASLVLRLVLVVAILITIRLTRHSQLTSRQNLAVVIVGLLLFLAGLGVATWARLIIGSNWGMPMSQRAEPELVTAGPYGVIRHPIYSGILLAMFGTVIAINDIWLIPLVVFGAYFVYSARVEEAHMLDRFPQTYPAYQQRTKMLLPFVF